MVEGERYEGSSRAVGGYGQTALEVRFKSTWRRDVSATGMGQEYARAATEAPWPRVRRA